MASSEELKQGQYIATTQIYDLDENAKNAKDFNVRLRQNLNNMIIALNAKVVGYYSQEEYMNGKLLFPDYSTVNSSTSTSATFRQVYCKTIDLGGLPGGAPYPKTKSVPHAISGYPAAGTMTFEFLTVIGSATNQATLSGLSLPFSSPTLADNIAIQVVGPNVVVTVGADYSAYTKAFAYLEYIKY